MPVLDTGEAQINFRWDGPADAPTLVLSGSLGTHLGMWDAQIPAFARHFRVLRYDARGHGASSVPPAPYTLEQLGRDVTMLLDSLSIEGVHFCGLSIGGMVGLWLGVHARERLDKLVVCNSAARIGTSESWSARIDAVKKSGMTAITPVALERWFTEDFRRRDPLAVERVRQMLLSTPVEGYAGACAALRDADMREDIVRIRATTLVVAGAHDPATTPADGKFIADRIAGASYVELEAAHLSNIEAKQRYNQAVLEFLTA